MREKGIKKYLMIAMLGALCALAVCLPQRAQATVPTWDVALSGPIPPFIIPSISLDGLLGEPAWFKHKEEYLASVSWADFLEQLIPSWDSAAWWATDIIIEELKREVINWAAHGFDDNHAPYFLQDPEKFLTGIGDQASAVFVEDLAGELTSDPQFFCTDFLPEIVLDIGRGGRGTYFGQFGRGRCTITDVISNIEDYQEDFENGRWDAFFKTRLRSNNRVGFYLSTLEEHDRRRWEAEEVFRRQEQHSGGYLGNVDCVESTPNGWCRKFSIRTPARAVAERVQEAVGVDFGRLMQSDELKEFLTELILASIRGAMDNFFSQ